MFRFWCEIITNFILYSSADGKNYTKIEELKFVGVNKMLTAKFPETKSKYFKLECLETNSYYPISEIELLKDNEQTTLLLEMPL